MTMTHYIGTKELLAKPMTRGEYNSYRGWETPEGENEDDAGYLVEYLDGGEANHWQHRGYISWSPKDVFDRSYFPCGTHVDRMKVEYAELKKRVSALTAFIGTETFNSLDQDEQSRLCAQHESMAEYRNILAERLKAASAVVPAELDPADGA